MKNKLDKAINLQRRMRIMRQKGKSVRYISNKLGLSVGTVSNYLNDKLPKNNKTKTKRSRVLTKEVRLKNRNRQYQYRYGITLEDYYKMYHKQKGKCAICDTPKPISGDDKMYIDHCHDTLKVRGLLCPKCNTSIARFNDDIKLLQKAINYLK